MARRFSRQRCKRLRAATVAALLTVLTDKDWRGVMGVLAPVVDVFVLTSAPTAPASRAWNAQEAFDTLGRAAGKPCSNPISIAR
jgi:folylpolyglutamate synthase/dihydropteroate synthase